MMKSILSFITIFFFSLFYSQQIPDVSITNISGDKLNISKIDSSEPVIIAFWATWCLPCMEELSTINEKYEKWKKDSRFSFYAVSTDDSRTSAKIKTIVRSRGWQYNILLDPNQILKRAFHISSIPFTIIIHKGKIIDSHIGYSPGDEDELYEKIKSLNNNY